MNNMDKKSEFNQSANNDKENEIICLLYSKESAEKYGYQIGVIADGSCGTKEITYTALFSKKWCDDFKRKDEAVVWEGNRSDYKFVRKNIKNQIDPSAPVIICF